MYDITIWIDPLGNKYNELTWILDRINLTKKMLKIWDKEKTS